MTSDLSPMDRLGEIRQRFYLREPQAPSRADMRWLLEHIGQLQGEIDRRNTPWQHSDLWGRMSAADPEIREALIQAWNERDRLRAAFDSVRLLRQRQQKTVLDLCDRESGKMVHPSHPDLVDIPQWWVRIDELLAALGVDRD